MELKLDHMTLQLELPPGVAADPKLLDGGHPLHYVLKMKKQTETYLNRVHQLLAGLPACDVLEFCAGIGLVHATNSHLYEWRGEHSGEPKPYYAGVELDANCEPLANKIAPGMDFHLGDMYDPEFTSQWCYEPEDTLVICEFPTNTLPKLWREPQRADLMKRIAEDIHPRYWYIADVGYYWIHLANHWPIYEAKFGVKPTRDNYHLLFNQYAQATWGYSVKRWTVGGGAQYFLLEPT